MSAWPPDIEAQWKADCLHWRGRELTGKHRHWCQSWDFLPVDETCIHEWPCGCETEAQS